MPRGAHYDERMKDPARVKLPEHLDLLQLLGSDPELVVDVVEREGLAGPPFRVAIQVAESGPYGLFELDGPRVTCLAADSTIRDAHRVSHTRLSSVVAERQDRAARYEAAKRLTGEQSPAAALLRHVVDAGRAVSREDFYAFAWFAPVVGKILLGLYQQGLNANHVSVLNLRNRRRATRRAPKILAGYEARFFRLGTLAMTVALSGRRLIEAGELTAEDAYESLVADLMALGTLGAAVRSAWVAAKLGNAIVQTVKKRYQYAETGTDLVYAAGPLLAIAARHQNLRSEIRDVLRGPLPKLDPEHASVTRDIQEHIRQIAQQLPPKDKTDFQLLRARGFVQHQQLTARLPSDAPHRISHVEQMPAELACAVLADSIDPVLNDEAFRKYLLLAPLVALQEPESFYLPKELLTALGRRWTTADTIRLARMQTNCPDPVRAEPKPGRNEPCPCGSGKKYKLCHG